MSLGKDLASIRKSQNLTLEDIQNAVKIPLHTLKSIEDDSIFSDTSENKTYIRSFVRSYAKVLKIDDKGVVKALDEMEAGTYSGSLLDAPHDYERPDSPDFFSDKTIKSQVSETKEPTEKGKRSEETEKLSRAEPSVASTAEQDTVNWADIGKKFTAAGKNSKIWMVASLVTVIVILIGSGFFFRQEIANLFGPEESPPSQENVTPPPAEDNLLPTPADSSALEESTGDMPPGQETESPEENTKLSDTLTVEVYAAFDKLDPVRVTSDFNWRTNPFWMEQGLAYKFDFKDTLLVRGQYSKLLLMFNGHIIENPWQNYFDTSSNSIVITRSILNQPEFLAPPPAEFPLEIGPPDSSIYRIRY